MIFRLAYLAIRNAFAALRLLTVNDRERTSRFSPCVTESPFSNGSSVPTPG
ncbi:hypothetical protein [Nonomuraea sp. NPDC049625]|uniref:hypothetical protein n=1 Tax=Nonomuraea sp. NPDC049625 TaxID=3155775 RepID=UPI003449B773